VAVHQARQNEPDDEDVVGLRARLGLPLSADPASRAWLRRLASPGREHDEAVGELHALLVTAARFALRRRATFPAPHSDTLDDLAVQAANDALVAILSRLGDYRGDSRFTTWAAKFAFFSASTLLRRRSWTGREIPLDDAASALRSRDVSAQRKLELQELLAALGGAIERRLTLRERTVFVAVALNGVPIDVLAARMGTTRGALYKTLHDARQKLRSHLAA
jgi:RNA polymerase sigma-70 factor (ECF subfamily)